MASSAFVTLIAVVGVTAIFGTSEWRLRRTHDVPLAPLRSGLESPDPMEGERLAKIVGCWAGCHGQTGQGGSIDMDGYYSVTAPGLPSIIPRYSDAELVRLIRFGVKRDGSSALGMTSYTFYPLADEDLANIISHLRRQPPLPTAPGHRTISTTARIKLALGEWQASVARVSEAHPGRFPLELHVPRVRPLALPGLLAGNQKIGSPSSSRCHPPNDSTTCSTVPAT